MEVSILLRKIEQLEHRVACDTETDWIVGYDTLLRSRLPFRIL